MSFVDWLGQLEFGVIGDTLIVVLASLLCISFHESCHGLAAWKLGDPTAKNQGRLTLNPLKHIDISGLVMMAIFKFGWAKPVPVDMRYFKRPKLGMALTALAGPLSNVVLAYVALLVRAVLLALITDGGALFETAVLFCEYVAILSTGLAVFNIIPLPPLDGSKVLFAFLPDEKYYRLMQVERWGMIILMVLLFVGVLDRPLSFLRSGLLDFLSVTAWFPYELIRG